MLPKMAGAAASWPKPRMGWIRLMRRALWMSPSELARALGVAQSSLTRLEQSEIRGTISLQSLKRAAEVLGCDVVYAFIPHQPLDVTVRAQALVLIEKSGQMQQLTRMISEGRLTPKSARRLLEGRTKRLLREPKFWSR
jgi:predicted DNA-binding mobile mystery protein A